MTTYVLPLCVALLGGSISGAQSTSSRGPSAAPARTPSFVDATYLTPKDFLSALTDVSVTIRAPRTTTQYVPVSELEADVADALRDYDIAVRPNSPIRLDVIVAQKDTTYIWNENRNDTQDMHDIVLSLSFQTAGVVRRGTKLYPIVAAPVRVEGVSSVWQGYSLRRALVGDETRQNMQEKFPEMLEDLLSQLADNDGVDPTPWYAAKWTDAQKAAANAEFLALMKGPVPQADHFVGLDVLPSMTTDTTSDVDGCRMVPRYTDEWQSEFRRIGWTKTSTEAPLLLDHSFRCDAIDVLNTPKYTRMWNSINLKEPNFVFMLNGRVVRKMAVISSWNVLATASRGESGRILSAIDEMFNQVQDQVEGLRVSAPIGGR